MLAWQKTYNERWLIERHGQRPPAHVRCDYYAELHNRPHDLLSHPCPGNRGRYNPKEPPRIIGGILTFESDWSPPLGQPLNDAVHTSGLDGRMDIGCIAAHLMFTCDQRGCHTISTQDKAATAFLLEFIAGRQSMGTVAMIDTRAYARWLAT